MNDIEDESKDISDKEKEKGKRQRQKPRKDRQRRIILGPPKIIKYIYKYYDPRHEP